ncbi:class I SAM-dependent methyltransferase [Mycobacterium neglectum]|uniref:class I SAM-dependent methyltransferase n=1 Tax=Mycobacterium neglectum TaxID=242737 RepID=UPI001C3F1A54|nr:class I SAM-dependent methyltransferase [Mycobacterium neglectum]
MLKPPDDARTPQQVTQHYEVERELAAILRNASKQDRPTLYAQVYDELFQRVPTHPQLTRKCSSEDTNEIVEQQMKFLHRFLDDSVTYLEIGAGDCAFAGEVASRVRKVYAVDVSAEVVKNTTMPTNGELVLSDGCSIPVPPDSVDVAYSNQLMEHLHPDDALEQLQNLHRAIAPGGRYVCVTPNRLNGPHDVSQFFDYEACGFHLKEYTTAELRRLFKSVGFRRSVPYVRVLGHFFKVPGWMPALTEHTLDLLPIRIRSALARRVPFRWLLGIYLVGVK